MSEPEELIIDAAGFATSAAVKLWRRYRGAADPGLTLHDVARRLELLSAALFDVSLTVAVADPPARPSLFGRIFGAIPAHLVDPRAMPATDGRYLRLPRTLDEYPPEDALARYQLWAGEQALRAARNAPAHWHAIGSEPARALYWTAEAATCDLMLAQACPRWTAWIDAERAHALARRPALDVLTPPERAVEHLWRKLLQSPVAAPPVDLPIRESADAVMRWANAHAAALPAGKWRGLPAVRLWGVAQPPAPAQQQGRAHPDADDTEHAPRIVRSRQMGRRPQVREPEDGEDDAGQGTWMVPHEDYHESVQDPMGLQRPIDRDDTPDLDDLADSLSNLEQARLVTAGDPAREVLQSDDPLLRAPWTVRPAGVDGVRYPEWDWRTSAYAEPGALVRTEPAPCGDPRWAQDVLTRHAALIEQVRRGFSQLRPRRVRLSRQVDGDELDIAACVEAHADRTAGQPPSNRLYQQALPRRRDVAISLLVDVSASTDSWVAQTQRIVDVEKEALLVLCEALDALGDPYSIAAFSGRGPHHVSIRTLKDFDQPGGAPVHRRIAALEPDRYTRAGAAIRHATAMLAKRRARHRLLLILSDGKPNDLDLYEGRYGVEDTRQAVIEARLQAIETFCLTVDRRAPAYMPRIFGASAFAMLRHPQRLPHVLVDVVRRLLCV